MYQIGERVIFQHPNAKLDGLRGQIESVSSGGYYDVRLDDGRLWDGVWESKLARGSRRAGLSAPRRGRVGSR